MSNEFFFFLEFEDRTDGLIKRFLFDEIAVVINRETVTRVLTIAHD